MTSRMYQAMIAAIALVASACATSHSAARPAYVPAGQAAQPGWSSAPIQVAESDGRARGQAAQPHSWNNVETQTQFAYGVPAGQAAQPYAWPSAQPEPRQYAARDAHSGSPRQ